MSHIPYSASRRKQPLSQWCVEGEYVTPQQIADRLGLTAGVVIGRLGRLRKLDGPITWEALAANPKPRIRKSET